jgi:poly-gamma-glutamate synthase PgsB/CapB
VTTLLALISAYVFALLFERIELARLRKSIPTVISVTGTRGKTSVVRLLASVLREDGRVVLAKSTGSEAQYVLPDGTVENVPRKGAVTILEQKELLRRASKLKVDCLVVEVMSIHPEYHVVESQRILKPDIVLLTNIRRDHMDAMGGSEKDVANVLTLDFPSGTNAYVTREAQQLLGVAELQHSGIRVHVVQPTQNDSQPGLHAALPKEEFSENLDLVVSAARALKVDDKTIVKGIQNAIHDMGRLRIWNLEVEGKRIYVVNGFAANDPESTKKVLEKTQEILGGSASGMSGLLNLRRDRPDRTVQWIEALNSGMTERFAGIYVLGGHANVVRRKTVSAEVLSWKTPEEITRMIARGMKNNGILFGFGNIGGPGHHLVEYWQRKGTIYGI